MFCFTFVEMEEVVSSRRRRDANDGCTGDYEDACHFDYEYTNNSAVRHFLSRHPLPPYALISLLESENSPPLFLRIPIIPSLST